MAGLALNLTPCVYPMVSVTASIFTRRADGNWRGSAAAALVYVSGIVFMYSALGLSAAFSGGILGAWMQNPWVLVAIAAGMVALALGMFGVWRFELPRQLTQGLAKASGGRAGLFVSGLAVGVFAAPCIGPPVAALMAHVAERGEPAYGLWIFFWLSLGLGFPYLFLGTFSSFIRKLPKSGAWLTWIEHLFGIILLSFAAYYLLVAFAPKKLYLLLPAALLTCGVFSGFVDRSGNENVRFLKLKRFLGIVAVIAAVFLAWPRSIPGVMWEWYSEEAFTEAKRSSQPIVLDFYADWCLPCHEMEATTYRDRRVVEALQNFRRFKVDMTRVDDEATAALAEKFDLYGLPTVDFYDWKGRPIPSARLSGYIGPVRFLDTVRMVLGEREKDSLINSNILESEYNAAEDAMDAVDAEEADPTAPDSQSLALPDSILDR